MTPDALPRNHQSRRSSPVLREPLAGGDRRAHLDQSLVGDAHGSERNVESRQGLRAGQVQAAGHHDQSAGHQCHPRSETIHGPPGEGSQSGAQHRSQAGRAGHLGPVPAELLAHGHHEHRENADGRRRVAKGHAGRGGDHPPAVVDPSGQDVHAVVQQSSISICASYSLGSRVPLCSRVPTFPTCHCERSVAISLRPGPSPYQRYCRVSALLAMTVGTREATSALAPRTQKWYRCVYLFEGRSRQTYRRKSKVEG